MNAIIVEDNEVTIQGYLKKKDFVSILNIGPIDQLSFISHRKAKKRYLLTSAHAKKLNKLKSVKRIWLWWDVTRPALRQIIKIPGLEALDVLDLVRPGRLTGFSNAKNLKELRCNFSLTESDLSSISTCLSIRELGAQNSVLSEKAINAFLNMRNLESLDIEASNFTDALAEQLSKSHKLVSLEVGSTNLTGAGLKHICRMIQLERLDLWATNIIENDLDLLHSLPNLKYLSVGGYAGNKNFRAETLIPRLSAIKSLESIWLDGIKLSEQQEKTLKERYKNVRITCEDWDNF
jgi:hypothetical protein